MVDIFDDIYHAIFAKKYHDNIMIYVTVLTVLHFAHNQN